MSTLKRTLIAAALGIGLTAVVPVTATAQTVAAQAQTNYVVGSSYLNARSGPGTQYYAVTTLAPGTPVTALSYQGSWVQVSVAGQGPLWVYGSYLNPVSGMPGNTIKIIPEAKPEPTKPAFPGDYPLVIRQ